MPSSSLFPPSSGPSVNVDDLDLYYDDDFDSLPEVSVYPSPSGTGSGPPSSASSGFSGFAWPHDADAAKSLAAWRSLNPPPSLSQVQLTGVVADSQAPPSASVGVAAPPHGDDVIAAPPTLLMGGATASQALMVGGSGAMVGDSRAHVGPAPSLVPGFPPHPSQGSSTAAAMLPADRDLVCDVSQFCQQMETLTRTKAEMKMFPPSSSSSSSSSHKQEVSPSSLKRKGEVPSSSPKKKKSSSSIEKISPKSEEKRKSPKEEKSSSLPSSSQSKEKKEESSSKEGRHSSPRKGKSSSSSSSKGKERQEKSSSKEDGHSSSKEDRKEERSSLSSPKRSISSAGDLSVSSSSKEKGKERKPSKEDKRSDKEDKKSDKEDKRSSKEDKKSSKEDKKSSSSSPSRQSPSSRGEGKRERKSPKRSVKSPCKGGSSPSKLPDSRSKDRGFELGALGGRSPLEAPHPGDAKLKASPSSSLPHPTPSTSGVSSGIKKKIHADSSSFKEVKEDPPADDEEVDSSDGEVDHGFGSSFSGSSPEHCRPSASSAVEHADEAPLGEELKVSFRRVIDIIREKCDLPPPPVEIPTVTLSRIERRHRQEPQGAASTNLPMSEMAASVLREMEEAISGPGNKSLASRKSKLLPPMPGMEQRHWYEFLGDSISSPKEIAPETADFLGSSKEALQAKGAHLSASEVLVVESLSLNSLKATSWLDYWLDAVDQLVSDDAPQELREMLRSGGKAIRYIASQSAALWASSVLFRRDAVLSGIRSLPKGQRQRLRNAPILDASSLFPASVVGEMATEKQARRDASLFSNVAKLADSAQKAVQSQKTASSSGYSASSSAGRRKTKKKPAVSLPEAQSGPSQSETLEDQSLQGKKAKRFFPGQFPKRRGRGRGKGRGQ